MEEAGTLMGGGGTAAAVAEVVAAAGAKVASGSGAAARWRLEASATPAVGEGESRFIPS